jgi:hypothetical protein
MTFRLLALPVVVSVVGLAGLTANTPSRSEADEFLRKVALIVRTGELPPTGSPKRTTITESELNSWFAYADADTLPRGLTNPTVAILGGGLVRGEALVDIEALSGSRQWGIFDRLLQLGGRVPVVVAGTVRASDGRGRFDLQGASVSGVPVPATLVQELVWYFSRTPDDPDGVRLEDAFELPARIRAIEFSRGQAVVVQ